MARKSRKGLETTSNREPESKDTNLFAGAYLRISKGDSENSSESIDNQLKIIEDHCWVEYPHLKEDADQQHLYRKTNSG